MIHLEQVSSLPSCYFPTTAFLPILGVVGGESTADPGVDDDHHQAGDQVLDYEADQGVRFVMKLI